MSDMTNDEKAALYEKVRRLNPRQFSEIWEKSMRGEKPFDILVRESLLDIPEFLQRQV